MTTHETVIAFQQRAASLFNAVEQAWIETDGHVQEAVETALYDARNYIASAELALSRAERAISHQELL